MLTDKQTYVRKENEPVSKQDSASCDTSKQKVTTPQ